ncbi:zinc knuckle CX2CX4HX4C containing protein [Tanacetum coccineum]
MTYASSSFALDDSVKFDLLIAVLFIIVSDIKPDSSSLLKIKEISSSLNVGFNHCKLGCPARVIVGECGIADFRVFPITLTGAAKGDGGQTEILQEPSRFLGSPLRKPLSKGLISTIKDFRSSLEEIPQLQAMRNEYIIPKHGNDMKKLKENVHAIQVGCQTYEEAHLVKECPLNEEVNGMEEVKYGEFSQPFPNNRYDSRFNKRGYDQPSSREKRPILTKVINKYMEEAYKRLAKQDEWLKKFYQSTEASRETHNKIIQGLEGKVKTLANEVEGRANNKKFEECKTIYSENGLPLYTPFYYSPEEIEYFSANSGFSDNEEQETDDSGMAEAVAALEATLKKKREEPKKMLGKLEPINMLIEMDDNTKCAPKGIVENLLIKIDKFIFPVYFVILDMVEDIRMPIILGRPLLATAYAQVDIFRKTISLEVGSEKVIFKMRSSVTTTNFESVPFK